MRNLIKIFLFVSVVSSTLSIHSQELNCNVQINSSQIQGSDKSVFDAMQKAIFEFVNNRKWTNNVFKNSERIECSILINITEQVSTNHFKATIQVQSRRPVYGTSYNTTLFNHLDKDFEFKFNEFDPLEYSETSYLSNLTSVLSYYANIILAMDYDSFSMKGGNKYLQNAQTIVNNAQSAQEAGWKAFEGDRNRYWLVDNLLHQNYIPLRECMYKYHRLGFDMMSKDVTIGRSVVFSSLQGLEKVYERKPGSFSLQIFFNAKSSEIVDLFIDGTTKEKAEITNLLTKIDANNLAKYDKIAKGK
ncbi:MAG: DUF4835 family protein [Vicingaceae bacterium]|nr:DUF4835 family protein [Vicingaceae bacterium]